ncbi:MAG: histidine kinase dimerization/phospho-acceptor domain-containing protein [Spirulinaceae cyanobacterium]
MHLNNPPNSLSVIETNCNNQPQVSDFMTTDIIQASAMALGLEIVQQMAENSVGYVVITETNDSRLTIPIGIITSQDIFQLIARGQNLQRILAQTIMSSSLFCTESSTHIEQAYQEMVQQQISHLVVVGSEGELQGVMTESNLLEGLANLSEYSPGNQQKINHLKQFTTQLGIAVEQHELYENVQQELAASKQVESSLKKRNEDLQLLLKERTDDLETTKSELNKEAIIFHQVEKAWQQTNAQLQAVLDAVPGCISWISADLKYLGVNQQLAELSQATPEEFINQPIEVFNSYTPFSEYTKHFFACSLQQDSVEIEIEQNNCLVTYLIVSRKYSQGQAAVFVGIDITERKQAEQELQKALTKEKELNELKTRFVTTTSHEFRTPLTTILGATELLSHYGNQWNEEKKQRYLTRIQTKVEYMTKMLDDILLLSQTDSGTRYF